MTLGCEFNGLFPFLSGSSDYNDRNGNDGIVFFCFKTSQSVDLIMQKMGGIKDGGVQIVNIDFHMKGKNVTQFLDEEDQRLMGI